MPTIEITDEQARALARGERVTVEPPRRHFENILIFSNIGYIYFAKSAEIRDDGLLWSNMYMPVSDSNGRHRKGMWTKHGAHFGTADSYKIVETA